MKKWSLLERLKKLNNMIVQIESSIYNSPKHFDVLDQIVPIFQTGKHIWDINDNPDIIIESEWMKIDDAGNRQRKRVDDLLKTAVKSLYIGKKQKREKFTISIEENAKDDFSYEPAIALLLLLDSVYIIVENSNSDKIFLEAIANAYKYDEIRNAIEQGWIKFDTEGGKGGIIRRIEFHQQKNFKPRLFVLLDSDKEFPKDTHKAEKEEYFCKENDVNCHILYKRAIENYIPDEAFNIQNAELNEIIKVYCLLNDDQKDFFDLKKGFYNKGILPKNQTKLFEGISSKNPVFKALRKGFNVRDFSVNNLYTFFKDNSNITKKTLDKRCINNKEELEHILNKISNLL